MYLSVYNLNEYFYFEIINIIVINYKSVFMGRKQTIYILTQSLRIKWTINLGEEEKSQ